VSAAASWYKADIFVAVHLVNVWHCHLKQMLRTFNSRCIVGFMTGIGVIDNLFVCISNSLFPKNFDDCFYLG
jgi:hypothetical protein